MIEVRFIDLSDSTKVTTVQLPEVPGDNDLIFLDEKRYWSSRGRWIFNGGEFSHVEILIGEAP